MKIQRESDLGHRRGFTLVELLVGLAIFAILLGLVVSVSSQARERSAATQTSATLRSLAQGALLYAQDNQGRFPRSFHSAGAYREPGWAASIAPYLGVDSINSPEQWKSAFNRYYRSPFDEKEDPSYYSFGLNVHFELDPSGDDYEGSPQTWRRFFDVPAPSKTILLAETPSVQWGDHFMSHLWGSLQAAENAVAHDRFSGGSFYAFVDGSVRLLPVEATFDPSSGINLWNPHLADR